MNKTVNFPSCDEHAPDYCKGLSVSKVLDLQNCLVGFLTGFCLSLTLLEKLTEQNFSEKFPKIIIIFLKS